MGCASCRSALFCSGSRRHRFGGFRSALLCSRTECLIVSQAPSRATSKPSVPPHRYHSLPQRQAGPSGRPLSARRRHDSRRRVTPRNGRLGRFPKTAMHRCSRPKDRDLCGRSEIATGHQNALRACLLIRRLFRLARHAGSWSGHAFSPDRLAASHSCWSNVATTISSPTDSSQVSADASWTAS